jgi:peptidoglycan/xylan/chitin deacetylase (PgdA/CDA1 family)
MNRVFNYALGLWFVILLAGCAHVQSPSPKSASQVRAGALCRGPQETRKLALVFTGHEFAEGGEVILDALRERKARASFFLTGDFLANPKFAPLIRRIIREGHYLGPHSDKHLLYCTWDAGRTTLVTREQFQEDLAANVGKIRAAGVSRSPQYFLPPYEHNNAEIARWTSELGFTLVNYTQGTRSAADYTGEADKNFVPSQAILDSIYAHEKKDPHGLNGFVLLLHIGAGPNRADKMHSRFPELLDHLSRQGYGCVRIDKLFN